VNSRLIPESAVSDVPTMQRFPRAEQILHYREILMQHFDPLTEQRIKDTIESLERRKEAMH
jgi:hypothetical protein